MRYAWVVACLLGCHSAPPPAAPIAASAPPVAAPAAPTCEATALHLRDVYTPEGTGEPAHTTALARCDGDHWGDHARRCMADAAKVLDLGRCFDQLTEAQASAFKAELARATRDGLADDIPPSCHRYARAIDRLVACDKIPIESRDALREAFRQTSEAWASVPPEQRSDLEAACQAATEAVEQSVASCG